MQRGILPVWFPAAIMAVTAAPAGAGTVAPEDAAGDRGAPAQPDARPGFIVRDHAAIGAWGGVLGGREPACLADAVAAASDSWGMAVGEWAPALHAAPAPQVAGSGAGSIHAAIAHLGCDSGATGRASSCGGIWPKPDDPLTGEEAFEAEAQPDDFGLSPPRRMPLPIPSAATGVGVLGVALLRRRL